MNRSEKRRQQKLARKTTKNENQVRPTGAYPNTKASNVEASLELAIQLHQAGRLSEAETSYQQILQFDPVQSDAIHMLGVIALQRGENDHAVGLISKALAINPTNTDAHCNLGAALQRLRRLDEAAACYHNALEIDPDIASVHYDLGNTLKELGRLNEAMASYHKALVLNPSYAEAHSNLGDVLRDLGQLNEATASYQTSLEIDPSNIVAFSNLGDILHDQGRLDEAVAKYNAALRIDNDYAEVHCNLGIVLQDLGRLNEAVTCFRTAISIKTDFAKAHSNLGNALRDLGKLDEAVANYHKAIKICPDFAEAHHNLGNALKDLGQLDDAVASYQQATRINVDYEDAYCSLGYVSQELNNWNEALACYQKAIAIRNDFAKARKNLGILQLLMGNFQDGWRNYAWRFQTGGFPWRHHNHRDLPEASVTDDDEMEFLQSSYHNKKLLIWMEQGIGDEIMFASMLPELTIGDGSIVVECEERLLRLFERSFADISFIARQCPPATELVDGEFDYQLPAGNLAAHFRGTMDSFPKRVSFLHHDKEKQASFRDNYTRQWPSKMLIGISWRSGNTASGAKRSMSLNQWSPLLANSDCQFVSLQYGEVEEDLAAIKTTTGADVFHDASVDPLTDLDVFAAQIAALDLVISIDNSTVHMAGALGIPTWVMLSYSSDWRWLIDRDDSPWYSVVRLFRQESSEDWVGVADRVNNALGSKIGNFTKMKVSCP